MEFTVLLLLPLLLLKFKKRSHRVEVQNWSVIKHFNMTKKMIHTILEELFFVIKQLFVSFSGIFKIGPLFMFKIIKNNKLRIHPYNYRCYFNNSIDWTRFLTKSTINTFGHINIIASGSSTTIGSFFSFNGDRLRF